MTGDPKVTSQGGGEFVRLVNDETGWTDVYAVHRTDLASVRLPTIGGGQIEFARSGEVDEEGRPIFRTRQQ